jgi:antitoxin VapB
MALNIKDPETEKLAGEVAEMTGDSKTGAVREALRERRDRLGTARRPKALEKYGSMQEWLENEIWPHIPPEELDQPPMTKSEVEEILGFGPEGY